MNTKRKMKKKKTKQNGDEIHGEIPLEKSAILVTGVVTNFMKS
jgi:hypothetical protein